MPENMKSPDGKYEVVQHDYGEIRMGSPAFGRLKILGSGFEVIEGEFGEAMAFSPDSRFLATELLVDAAGPHTQAVVFDFERTVRIIVHHQNPGFMRSFKWSDGGLLTLVSWANMQGEREHVWQAPPPREKGFWERVMG